METTTTTRCWLHLICSTYEGEKFFFHKETALKLRNFLFHFSETNNIRVKACCAVGEHVHILVDLPVHYSIDKLVIALKNATSEWLNEQNFFEKDFTWDKNFGAFSVSPSNIQKLIEYINDQEDHHRSESFEEEYQHFVEAYGIF